MLAIYDGNGRLLAESGRDGDLEIALPPLDDDSDGDELLQTVLENGRRRPPPAGVPARLDSAIRVHRRRRRRSRTDGRGARVPARDPRRMSCRSRWSRRRSAGRSWRARVLSPVVAMADRARRIGVENLSERLPVANPRDELGHLAETFNELLGRLEASLVQQRQFMADASHELRTPVTTTRTAAAVALQQQHRDESEYRETLEIVEQQAARLSRVVDDMFMLARADAGNYPVRTTPMYLDEVIDEVVRAARVVAATRDVSVETTMVPSAAFTGDEELVRRMIANLVDNAVRHAPAGSTVRVELDETETGYAIAVKDRAREFRLRSGRTSSNASSEASLRVGRARRTARDLVWRWRGGLPARTAATSCWPGRRRRARRSSISLPSRS